MSDDGLERAPAEQARQSGLSCNGLFVVAIACAVVFYLIIREIFRRGISLHSIAVVFVLALVALAFLAFLLSRSNSSGFIEHVEVTSPGFAGRAQKHYDAAAAQLKALGFNQLFVFGEAIAIPRIFLVAPAVVLFRMWLRGDPLELYPDKKILNANPVFGAGDKSAYAHPNGLGISFHTALRDGTIIVTRNHKDPGTYPPNVIVNSFESNLELVWAAHQRAVDKAATAGNPVDRQASFAFYSAMVRKEAPTGR